MQFLKADTAATILIGPFLDKGDGVTPETGITLGAADSAEIMKHDGTTFADISALTFTHKAHGMYTMAITTGFVDTEGRLTIFISDESVCLPVWAEFMVVNANVYDSLFAAATTDYLRTDVKQVGGTAQTANDNGADINAILADTGTDGVVVASASKTGYALSAAGIDAVHDEEVDNDGTAISLRGAVKLLLSILTAKSSGGGSSTVVFRDINDSKNRLSATVDSNGNRTAVGTRDAG